MKTVKIMIEVEVPDWTTHVAVDSDGKPFAYNESPEPSLRMSLWDNVSVAGLSEECEVINWRETLTEVK